MAIRKIEYTVTAEGISPATVQPGGVQGEHRATELVFNLTAELYQSLEALKGDTGRLVYRIDGYNGEGGVHRSDVGELTQAVSYPIEEWLTRCGGIIKAVLVVSLIENDTTEMEIYSFPAVLRLKSQPDGVDVDGENTESMSTLAQVAKSSAETAVQSAEIAVEAKDKTVQAKAALEDGATWIFDGGDASNEADIEFVIDGKMSDTSENAVKNRVIKAYVDNLVTTTVAKVKTEIEKSAKLDAHPIGSLYFSSEATEPSELFGGTWERIKDTFILAAGDSYSAGESGGKSEVALTPDQAPEHAHNVYSLNVNSGGSSIIENYFNSPYALDYTATTSVSNKGYSNPIAVGSAGKGLPHENMPPYEVYYCWKRTA